MSLMSSHFQPSATWTFVHSNGKHTDYILDRQIAKAYQDPKSGYGLSAMYALLNPETGKFAQVTERWLRQPPLNSAVTESGLQSHWVAVEAATTETTEAYIAEREALV